MHAWIAASLLAFAFVVPAQVPQSASRPAAAPRVAPEKQTAKLAIEKRKRGKMVTVVRGLAAEDNDLNALLTELKSVCGAGGAVKGDVLEIQGRQLDRLRAKLQEIGYRVKG